MPKNSSRGVQEIPQDRFTCGCHCFSTSIGAVSRSHQHFLFLSSQVAQVFVSSVQMTVVQVLRERSAGGKSQRSNEPRPTSGGTPGGRAGCGHGGCEVSGGLSPDGTRDKGQLLGDGGADDRAGGEGYPDGESGGEGTEGQGLDGQVEAVGGETASSGKVFTNWKWCIVNQ